MTTFTDENSALGDLSSTNHPATLGLGIPAGVGTVIATITYLLCRDTGAQLITISVGMVAGIVFMSLCFVSELERQMLVESYETCVSQQEPTSSIKGSSLWLKLQCLFLASAVLVFFGLVIFGDPVFQLYLETKEAYSF